MSLQILTFCLAYYQPYEGMTGPKSSELLTYLLSTECDMLKEF